MAVLNKTITIIFLFFISISTIGIIYAPFFIAIIDWWNPTANLIIFFISLLICLISTIKDKKWKMVIRELVNQIISEEF